MNNLHMKALLLIVTLMAPGAVAQSYKMDTIKFPHYVVPEVGGLGFTPAGDIVVALRRHGILVAQPDTDPDKFKWRVFAEDMLHNICGLQVISNSEMIVSQMAELTRVKDSDGDGIADLYETISDAWGVSGNYHETNTIIPDKKGGWYMAIGTASHNGPTFYHTKGEFKFNGRRGRNFAAVPWKGWVMHIDKNGLTTPYCKGFRANNGIGMSPDGKIFVTDNQGDWRGTSPVYHIEKDKFYGHPSSLVWDEDFVKTVSDNPLMYYMKNNKQYNKDRTPAAIELPHGFMCNSPSELIFDTKGSFGPFAGQGFVGDVAGGRIVRLMFEEVQGVTQGACVLFVDKGLRAGNNRLVFSAAGNTLYSGQTVRGWGRPSEGLQRLRFTGKRPFEVKAMSLLKDGFKLTFTKALDQESAAQKDHYEFKRYFYNSSHRYGSAQKEMTQLKVEQVYVSNDGLTVSLKIDGLKTGRVFELNINPAVRSVDNEKVGQRKICYTVNALR